MKLGLCLCSVNVSVFPIVTILIVFFVSVCCFYFQCICCSLLDFKSYVCKCNADFVFNLKWVVCGVTLICGVWSVQKKKFAIWSLCVLCQICKDTMEWTCIYHETCDYDLMLCGHVEVMLRRLHIFLG